MKKILFGLLLIFTICIGLQSCERFATIAESEHTYIFERVQYDVVYTIIDMGKQFCGNAYTTEFKWFLVLYNSKNGKYYVKEVKPEIYYKKHVGDKIVFK
jgi:hypothetical protein